MLFRQWYLVLAGFDSAISTWNLTFIRNIYIEIISTGTYTPVTVVAFLTDSLKYKKFFRRIKYGNMTHVNVSVAVTDDNKAVMYVALDRSGMSLEESPA